MVKFRQYNQEEQVRTKEKEAYFNKRGFTLVELIVVMVILGMLAALVFPKLISKVGKGKTSTAKTRKTTNR